MANKANKMFLALIIFNTVLWVVRAIVLYIFYPIAFFLAILHVYFCPCFIIIWGANPLHICKIQTSYTKTRRKQTLYFGAI